MSTKNVFKIGIKLLIIGLLVWILIGHFSSANDREIWAQFSDNYNKGNLVYLLCALFLVFINWGLEALKWKNIVQEFIEINFHNAWKGVIMGVSFSLMTPLRLGDYIGRILPLSKANSGKGLVANFLLSLAQNIVHIGLGFLAFLVYMDQFSIQNILPSEFILILSSIVILMLLYLYFKPSILSVLFSKEYWPDWIRRFNLYFEYIQDLSRKLLMQLLGLSLVRYFVFLIQYYCLIRYFGLDLTAFEAVIGIASIYLVQSAIPLPALVGFVARAEIAIIIWGAFTNNILGILAASYSLWIINQLLPAILGLFYFMRTGLNITFPSIIKKRTRLINDRNDPNPEL